MIHKKDVSCFCGRFALAIYENTVSFEVMWGEPNRYIVIINIEPLKRSCQTIVETVGVMLMFRIIKFPNDTNILIYKI